MYCRFDNCTSLRRYYSLAKCCQCKGYQHTMYEWLSWAMIPVNKALFSPCWHVTQSTSNRTWQRPCSKWIDQLRDDSGLSIGDLWSHSVSHGHDGATTWCPRWLTDHDDDDDGDECMSADFAITVKFRFKELAVVDQLTVAVMYRGLRWVIYDHVIDGLIKYACIIY